MDSQHAQVGGQKRKRDDGSVSEDLEASSRSAPTEAKRYNGLYDEEDGRRKKADYSESCFVQAIVRSAAIPRGGRDGNLLKAAVKAEDSEKKLAIDFTGTDPSDSSSVFHLDLCDGKDAIALRHTFGSHNYFLRVYTGGKLMLRKLVDFPTKDEYFFQIKSVNRFVPCPVTLRSLATKEYVACDENANAIMEEATSVDMQDRRLWFGVHYYGHGMS